MSSYRENTEIWICLIFCNTIENAIPTMFLFRIDRFIDKPYYTDFVMDICHSGTYYLKRMRKTCSCKLYHLAYSCYHIGEWSRESRESRLWRIQVSLPLWFKLPLDLPVLCTSDIKARFLNRMYCYFMIFICD